MSNSEVITLITLFHSGEFRNMKHFYLHCIQKHLQSSDFPETAPYNRFTELMQSAVLPITLFIKWETAQGSLLWIQRQQGLQKQTIKCNRAFMGIAELGKSTMSFFFGFKLHLIVNDKGEILNFVITQKM